MHIHIIGADVMFIPVKKLKQLMIQIVLQSIEFGTKPNINNYSAIKEISKGAGPTSRLKIIKVD